MKSVATLIHLSTSMPLNHAQTATQATQGTATLLTENAGARRITLQRNSNGSVDIELSPPPVTQLILSGGGAKGIAFPGVIQALEDKCLLKGVVSISGSSAGGISAALLASGMSAEAFKTLSNSIDFPELLNSSNSSFSSLQNTSTALGQWAGRLPGKTGALSQLLLTVLPRLQSKAAPLEELIRRESRKVILAHIADMDRATRPASVMAIADKLHKGGATTFADLDVLSRHICEIKRLNITGVGLLAGRAQLVVFNTSLTPDMEIARAAHISGALPVLFKQPVEQGLAFQKSDQRTSFQDGGLLLNTPDIDALDNVPPYNTLSAAEKLIIKFEAGDQTLEKTGTGFVSHALHRLSGIPSCSTKKFAKSRSEAFSEQHVALPLNTNLGDFRSKLTGTVNFTMSPDTKKYLQKLSHQTVTDHLNKRAAAREQYQFASMEEAVLAMDDELFSSIASALEKQGGYADILQFRQHARLALESLNAAISEANTEPTLQITQKIGSALRKLDSLARCPEQIDWLGEQLNTAENCNFQQLLHSCLDKSAHASESSLSRVMSSALAEAQKRNVAVIAKNFTLEVIYPSLFLPGQPVANLNLLRRAEHTLKSATTATQVNQTLDDIINHYVARNKPWKHQQDSTTVEMAKAWRMRT